MNRIMIILAAVSLFAFSGISEAKCRGGCRVKSRTPVRTVLRSAGRVSVAPFARLKVRRSRGC